MMDSIMVQLYFTRRRILRARRSCFGAGQGAGLAHAAPENAGFGIVVPTQTTDADQPLFRCCETQQCVYHGAAAVSCGDWEADVSGAIVSLELDVHREIQLEDVAHSFIETFWHDIVKHIMELLRTNILLVFPRSMRAAAGLGSDSSTLDQNFQFGGILSMQARNCFPEGISHAWEL